jgi:ABC-type nickel/cobalt efflux system permease component RcnA
MNWTFILLLLGAFGFGVAHAFEPDHMAAVSTFVASRPKPREAALFGVKWAIGHGLSLFLIGSLLFVLKQTVEKKQPELLASGVLDRVVGLVLVGLGVWTLFQVVSSRASKAHAHGHFHDGHFHTHEGSDHSHDAGHGHSHTGGLASLGMGVLHGAAGTGAFVGQSVVALSSSYAFVFFYTLLFSLGVLLSMGVYAGALGGLITTFEKRGTQALNGARVVTAVLTCAIGFCLISGIELPGLLDHFVH